MSYFVPNRVASFEPQSFTNTSFTISTDLQEPISVTLKNFVKANWPTTSMLHSSQIKFGNKTWDNFGQFQMHFRDGNIRQRASNISWTHVYLYDFVDVHIWVRKNQLTRPTEIDDMKRSLSAVIEENKVNLPITKPNGGQSMHKIREKDMQEEEPLQTLWHSVVTIEVRYWKALSNQ